jgi:hypothetical protein
MTLSGYLKFGGVCFILVTLYLSFFQTEDPVDKNSPESNMDVKKVYEIMYEICKLKHVQSFILLHCIAKLGVSVNDAATSLKLLEKGLSKEDMALSVLIDFPFQIFLGYFAAKWSTGDKPLQPVSILFTGLLSSLFFLLIFFTSVLHLLFDVSSGSGPCGSDWPLVRGMWDWSISFPRPNRSQTHTSFW